MTIEGGRMAFWPHGDHTLWSVGIHGNYLDLEPSYSCFSKEAWKNICQDVVLLPKNVRKFLTVFSKFLNFQVNYVGRWSDVCPEVSSMREWISYRYHYHFCWWNMTGYKCNVMGQVTDQCQCTICRQVEQIWKFTIQYLQPSILASAKLKNV